MYSVIIGLKHVNTWSILKSYIFHHDWNRFSGASPLSTLERPCCRNRVKYLSCSMWFSTLGSTDGWKEDQYLSDQLSGSSNAAYVNQHPNQLVLSLDSVGGITWQKHLNPSDNCFCESTGPSFKFVFFKHLQFKNWSDFAFYAFYVTQNTWI